MYTCNSCSCTLKSVDDYCKHQQIHSKDLNLQILCPFSYCKLNFTSYDNFRKHIYRQHKKMAQYQTVSNYFCKEADCDFECVALFPFKKHLYGHLSLLSRGITCPFPNCPKPNTIFQSKTRYSSHLCISHSKMQEGGEAVGEIDKVINIDQSDRQQNSGKVGLQNTRKNLDDNNVETCKCKEIDEYDSDKDDTSDMEEAEESEELNPSGEQSAFGGVGTGILDSENMDVTKTLAKMFLLLSVKHFATEPILQNSIHGITSAFETCHKQFMSNLENSNFLEQEKKQILNLYRKCFTPFSGPLDICHGSLKNTYFRDKFYTENFNVIQPIEVKLNNDKNKNHLYHYVPILKTLELLLSNENVRDYCENNKASGDGKVLLDICDGTLVKNNQFLNKSRVLHILPFQDAFEVVNPLGSSKKLFKLIGVYMALGNLPAYLRSKTENLKLILLVREKYVKLYGWDMILKEMMRDMRILESEGISISFQGQKIYYSGTFVAMLGDSLGSHQIGGFCENFSKSIYFCRFCEITAAQLKAGDYGVKILRNVENYTECCDNAEKLKRMVKGVKRNSVLNTLLHYNVCNPGLPPCIAHDFFEGIVPYDFMFSIKHFIAEGWFSYGDLNDRIQTFRFWGENKETLPPIEGGNKLIGTASEIRRLIMIFPVIVADRITDFEDDVWMMLMHLREVCALVCAPAISMEQVALLQEEIHQYLDLRIHCFADIPLQPKHHFIAHYPSLIVQFGPLKHLWTLRFESKHSYFKNIVRRSKNFKNLTKLLSRKHEQLQYICMSDESVYDSKASIKRIVTLRPDEFSDEECKTLVFDLLKAGKALFVSTEINFRGIIYKEGMCICVGKSQYGNFIIMTIDKILIDESKKDVHFLGNLQEVAYNQQIGVYEEFAAGGYEPVQSGPTVVEFSALLSPDPFLRSNIGSTEIFVCKYAPLNCDI